MKKENKKRPILTLVDVCVSRKSLINVNYSYHVMEIQTGIKNSEEYSPIPRSIWVGDPLIREREQELNTYWSLER